MINIFKMKAILILLTIILGSICQDETIEISIKYNNDKSDFIFVNGVFSNEGLYIAGAKFTKSLESKGWDLLAIKTNPNMDDITQAQAAGYLEGYITKDRIWNHYRNLRQKLFDDKNLPDNMREFLTDQEQWLETTYNQKPEDRIINNAYLTLQQFNELRKGYNENVISDMVIELVEFHVMTSFGDLIDIKYYKNKESLPDFKTMSAERLRRHFHEHTHCSALWKVKDDLTDIFFGHNSWFFYSSMTRIFKEYNFNFSNPTVKARNIMFSSYPAVLSSNDDFYLTSQNLAVIETTNAIFDTTLYDHITPKSLLCWQRAMIANRLSTTSKEWTDIFGLYNSGTYNNQFMVLDMNKVDLDNQQISDNAMYIIEQIPGLTETTDVTTYLRYGYWPSYNTPYSRRIAVLSGIDEIIKEKPEMKHEVDYETCARANLFRRDQGKVIDDLTYKKIMRYNDYKNDPLSLYYPGNAIASRFDLSDDICMGAYDAKTTSVTEAKGKNKKVNLISGPTNDQQPNFKWGDSTICSNDPRIGLSEEFNFTWFEYTSEFQIDDTEQLKYMTE
jgi:hypothetical protein